MVRGGGAKEGAGKDSETPMEGGRKGEGRGMHKGEGVIQGAAQRAITKRTGERNTPE